MAVDEKALVAAFNALHRTYVSSDPYCTIRAAILAHDAAKPAPAGVDGVEAAEDAAIAKLWALTSPQKTETYAQFKERDPIGWEEHEALGASVARAVIASLSEAPIPASAQGEAISGTGGVREALVAGLKDLASGYWQIKTAAQSNPVFLYEHQIRLIEQAAAALSQSSPGDVHLAMAKIDEARISIFKSYRHLAARDVALLNEAYDLLANDAPPIAAAAQGEVVFSGDDVTFLNNEWWVAGYEKGKADSLAAPAATDWKALFEIAHGALICIGEAQGDSEYARKVAGDLTDAALASPATHGEEQRG